MCIFAAIPLVLVFPSGSVSRRSDQSNWVKVGQTSLVGQAGASNLCKYFKMNSLQHNQPQSGLTGINLVTHGQNKPIRFGLRPVRRCQIEGRPVSGPKIWSCAGRGGCYSSGSRANGLRGGFVFNPLTINCENFFRHVQFAAGQEHRRFHRPGAGQMHHQLLSRRRNVRQDRGECARGGCVHRAIHFAADQPSLYGIVHHDGCGAAGQRVADHGGVALLRVCAAGPQGPAARADHGQIGGQSAGRGRGAAGC